MNNCVTRDELHLIPQCPGVYRFYSEQDHLLYIGKSISLRNRVRSHFANAKHGGKEERLAMQTTKITWQETVGELGALLLEADLIKKCQPIYNRMLRRSRILYGLKLHDKNAYHEVSIERLQDIDYADTRYLYGLSRSKNKLRADFIQLIKGAHLCGKLTGLEKGKGPCFYYQLKYCQGACLGLEKPEIYNHRLLTTLQKISIKSWPFEEPLVIEEQDKSGQVTTYHLIDKWCHVCTAESKTALQGVVKEGLLKFDFDIYKILAGYLLKRR